VGLYAEVAGEGPAVVLVHEGICDSRMWEPQWETFTRAHRVLRLDLRGFGRSPLEPGRFSNARDLIETLERYGFERAALVGVSLGGRVALEVAIARPELVSTLVLVAAGLPGEEPTDEIRAAWAEEEAHVGGRPAATARGCGSGGAQAGGRDAAPSVRAPASRRR